MLLDQDSSTTNALQKLQEQKSTSTQQGIRIDDATMNQVYKQTSRKHMACKPIGTQKSHIQQAICLPNHCHQWSSMS